MGDAEEAAAVAADANPYENPHLLRRPASVAEIDGTELFTFQEAIGNDINRRGPFMFLVEDDVLAYTSMNCVVFENLTHGTRKYLPGIDENGVGAMAVHPSRSYIAVGGKGFNPRIFIYSYPDLEIVKICSGGAERGYASLHFNVNGESGDKLASVATGPDFMLTIWDWQNEAVELHSKAFGQDVVAVKFSQDDDRRLTTSGSGHIRFWKMAATFTGLKLQGYIGKFGKVDLSDISTFMELPDAKVISGSESGSILLWEGNFIKCRFVRPDVDNPQDLSPRSRMAALRSPRSNKIMCHAGEIHYIDLDREERCIITAGEDGYIRWWDYDIIDKAEVDSDITMDFEIAPRAEWFLGVGRGIRSVMDSGVIGGTRFFVILDKQSNLTMVRFPVSQSAQLVNQIESKVEPEMKFISAFQGGPILGMGASFTSHKIATCGVDGSITLFEYDKKKIIAKRCFDSKANCLEWIPQGYEKLAKYADIVAGFEDGVIRFFSVKDDLLTLVMSMKPHNAPVTSMAFSPEHMTLAISGKDGIIWFFDAASLNESKQIEPIRFTIPVPATDTAAKNKFKAYIEKLNWDPTGCSLLISCSDRVLREVDATLMTAGRSSLGVDFETYSIELPVTELTVKMAITSTNDKGSKAPGSPSKTAKASPTKTDSAPSGEEDKSEELKVEATEEGESPPESAPQQGDEGENEEVVVSLVPLQAIFATYIHDYGDEKKIAASCKLNDRNIFCEYTLNDEESCKEFKIGLNSDDGKLYSRPAFVSLIQHDHSKKFLFTGADDGSISIRPSKVLPTFVRIAGHNNGPVTSVTFSHDDKYLFSAGVDGILAIHRIDHRAIERHGEELFLNMDAGVYGNDPVRPFMKKPHHLKQNLPPSPLLDATNMELEAPEPPIEPAVGEVPDVEPGSYSIEDFKIKTGEDLLKMSAEERKERTRKMIQELRDQFEEVRRKNMEIDECARLTDEEMVVDPELVAILKAEGEAALEETRKIHAYANEKALKLKEKLYERLMEGCLVEKMPLFDLNYNGIDGSERQLRSMVYSIRTRAMDSSIEDILESVRSEEKKNAIAAVKARAEQALKENAESAVQDVKHRIVKDEGSGFDLKAMKWTGKTGTNAAARKEMRLDRKSKLAAHNLKKPNEDDDDPRDIAAIKYAEDTLGVYVSKASESYKVPEGQEVNAEKKKRQMVLLEESMIVLRLQFNEKFLALRHLKKQLIKSIQQGNQRVRDIDIELGQPEESTNLWEPVLESREFPDDRDEVTEVELEAFRQSKAKNKDWIKTIAPINSTCTGDKTSISVDIVSGEYNIIQNDKMKNQGAGPVIEQKEDEYKNKKYYEVDDRLLKSFSSLPLSKVGGNTKGDAHSLLATLEQSIPGLITAKNAMKKLVVQEESITNNVLKNFVKDRRNKLLFERERILKNIKENASSFRDAIDSLRKNRHEITADIKLAELKLITLFQEYKLLLTFETRDLALQNKRVKCKKDKNEIVSNIADFQATLDTKLEVQKEWQAKLLSIADEYNQLVPESSVLGNADKDLQEESEVSET